MSLDPIESWFASRGWAPFEFQRETWRAQLAGRSGLIHVPTGAGKTYAAFMGPLAELIAEAEMDSVEGLRVLVITPLRAVSRDTEAALRLPIEELDLADRVSVESRTGDTSSSVRARQRERLPSVLITTPESLSLLLTRDDASIKLGGVRTVIVDEWHELLASKRGTQVELALARLRRFSPGLTTWGMSATLSNLEEAARTLVGVGVEPVLVGGELERPVNVETVLPREDDTLPWAGHLGLVMLPAALESVETDSDGLPAHSTLVFVNTRSQAERWFNAIEAARPQWRPVIGLHHGSIDRDDRHAVEAGLKSGKIRLVVATSSLDLGVDFAPVERVMQIGSIKGVARLMQRAGRASHRPGAPCLIRCVPTNTFELFEIAAARRAIEVGAIEPRVGERAPIDVLSQHLVTVALGGGFESGAMHEEVRTAWSYRDLPREEFEWALDLVVRGGETLKAYPEYHRVVAGEDGVHRVEGKRLAQLHRMNVGTITGDAVMDIRFKNGKKIGFIEESFIDKLRPGETFFFAGRTLAFERVKDLTAFVRPATGRTNHTPIWGGTRLPISESLSDAVRDAIEAARDGRYDAIAEPELAAARRFVGTQVKLSRLPDAGETLAEITTTREGTHLFLFPFEGRLVHGGLAALLALRLSRLRSATFSTAVNDYGLELLTEKNYPFAELLSPALFTTDGLAEDAVESVNLSAMAKTQFREVARVAGLISPSQPGAPRSMRQVQAR
ncbi:MAG: ligase-associated DNA damage response DEXH box helicase, partial [Planctomycetota bacterium]